MKVDTQQMDDAYSSLINLQNQFQNVENCVQHVSSVMMQYKFGRGQDVCEIIAALYTQLGKLNERYEGLRRLTQVLGSARDQYKFCEREAEAQSRHSVDSVIYAGLPDAGALFDFVPSSEIKQVVETLINPLIILPAGVLEVVLRYLHGLIQQGQNNTNVPGSSATPKEPIIHVNENYDIPNTQWKEITPRVTNNPGERSAEAYNAVLADLDVENRGRYARTSKDTWCNIYVWDATKAMGCEIPHYYSKTTGEPLTRAYCLQHPGEYYEMSANRMTSWLANYGSDYGWVECDADTAIAMANQGYPTVAAATSTNHVAMVVPQNEGESGVMISQAGAKNFEHGAINKGFGNHSVKYYYHL